MHVSESSLDMHIQMAILDWKADKALGREKSFVPNYLFNRYAFDRRYTVKCLGGRDNAVCGCFIIGVSDSSFYVDFTREGFNSPFTSYTIERRAK